MNRMKMGRIRKKEKERESEKHGYYPADLQAGLQVTGGNMAKKMAAKMSSIPKSNLQF